MEYYEEIYEAQKCIISGLPADMHHLKAKKITGNDGTLDVVDNLMPLARKYHNEIHQHGIIHMAEKYPQVKYWLENHGWIHETKEMNQYKDRYINYKLWERLL